MRFSLSALSSSTAALRCESWPPSAEPRLPPLRRPVVVNPAYRSKEQGRGPWRHVKTDLYEPCTAWFGFTRMG
jgi:hypothetical protein